MQKLLVFVNLVYVGEFTVYGDVNQFKSNYAVNNGLDIEDIAIRSVYGKTLADLLPSEEFSLKIEYNTVRVMDSSDNVVHTYQVGEVA